MEVETDSKREALSVCWRNRTAPKLSRVRLLAVRTATPEGGVVVRVTAQEVEVSLPRLPHN
jgi:hypothetical protein